MDMFVTAFVITVVLYFLVFTRVPPDILFIAGLTCLLAFGVVTPNEAFMGFANPGVITVAVLYVVVAGLRDSGAVQWVGENLLGSASRVRTAQFKLMLPAAFMSAFINNTPIVAMLTSAAQDWSKRSQVPLSKLLIPISYASIMGGVCTLIGTSTNLVVNGLLQESLGIPGLGFFELAWVGLPLLCIGMLYMLTIGSALLPVRTSTVDRFDDAREYMVEVVIEANCPLVEKTIEEAGLRKLPGLFLVEIERDQRILPAVAPNERLHDGDRLIFAGVVESVVDLLKIRGLRVATDQVFKLKAQEGQRRLIEAVISPTNPCIQGTVRETGFRNLFNAAIIAVARNGERLKGKIGDMTLRPGDTLLLETDRDFLNRHRQSKDFLLVSELDGENHVRHERAPLAIAIIIAMVASVVMGLLPMVSASLLAAGAMLLTGCLSLGMARRSIDFSVILVVGCAFAMGVAMEKTGLANSIAQSVLHLAGGEAWLSLVLIYLVTAVFTETITNNAAAILMFPIAMATSGALGVNYMPFVICVMVAASASFSTPIGYQTNLMVYGPGGYRFTDYLKVGQPLSVILGLTAVAIIPWVWPF